jgi:hypothetical protein
MSSAQLIARAQSATASADFSDRQPYRSEPHRRRPVPDRVTYVETRETHVACTLARRGVGAHTSPAPRRTQRQVQSARASCNVCATRTTLVASTRMKARSACAMGQGRCVHSVFHTHIRALDAARHAIRMATAHASRSTHVAPRRGLPPGRQPRARGPDDVGARYRSDRRFKTPTASWSES